MIEAITNNVATAAAEQSLQGADNGPGAVSPEDKTRFDAALNASSETTLGESSAAVQGDAAVHGETTLSGAIFDQVEALKTSCDTARNNINQRLASIQGGEFGVAEVIRLQQDLAAFNLQATFASKVTEEVNQDIQTMMKSQ